MDIIGNDVNVTPQGISFIPDEIILTNILNRLPVKSAMKCRLVCKKWRDLTCTHEFVHLHSRNYIPTILVQSLRSPQLDMYAVEKWWERGGNGSIIHTFPFSGFFLNASDVIFSHAGLIAFQDYQHSCSEKRFVILNPTRPSCESVKISFCEEFRRSKVFGIYFHPVLKEYCSLWKIDASVGLRGQPKQIHFGILYLGSNPFLKLIIYPFSNRVERDNSNPIFANNSNPLFIKNRLYWLLKSEQQVKYSGRNDIMEFDIVSEEFKIIPCPVPLDRECMYYDTHLLNNDGILSLILFFQKTITMWKLEDHAEQLWTTNEYHIDMYICYFDLGTLRGIALADENLAFLSEGRIRFCSLVDGSVKNRPKRSDVFILSHQMSLGSLKNCKSTISIDKYGEVFV